MQTCFNLCEVEMFTPQTLMFTPQTLTFRAQKKGQKIKVQMYSVNKLGRNYKVGVPLSDDYRHRCA